MNVKHDPHIYKVGASVRLKTLRDRLIYGTEDTQSLFGKSRAWKMLPAANDEFVHHAG